MKGMGEKNTRRAHDREQKVNLKCAIKFNAGPCNEGTVSYADERTIR